MSSNSPVIYKIKELNPDMIMPTTELMNDPEKGGSKTIVIGKPGCFTAGTKIMMYNGDFKNVEDIKVGEQIMGDDSTHRVVLELCRNNDEMFEIIPDDNNCSYTVNKQHKLLLKPIVNFENYKINNVYEITIENYLLQNDEYKKNMNIYRNSIEFREKYISLDNISLDINFHQNIPSQYIINSKKNRLLFLSEILDRLTNSIFYDVNDKCLTCYFINELFANDFTFLCKSLGFLIKDISVQNTNKLIILQIFGDLQSLSLKNYNLQDHKNNYNLYTSFKVVPKGMGNYYGFTLNGNHRFMLASCDVVRNTGKSTLIASLLYAKKHIFPVAIAFSGSEDSNGFYRKLLPSTFVYNDYDEEAIKNFVRRQKIAKQHLENPWAVILIDDCTDDPRVFNTPLQQGMYKRGRHWKMWYILSLQYSMDVKPVIRTNVDNVFILREPILKNRKSLWENYASIIPDFTLFCQILDQITDDYTALYIHNQTRSNDWRDCVFWYKAPLTPEGWKFGSPEYHDFHNQRYNQDYIDPFDRV